MGVKESFCQAGRELAGATAKIDDRLGAHSHKSRDDGVVNGPVRRVLKTRTVVDRRPAIEQHRSCACHGSV